MPTTQASVERLFPALNLILNDLRQGIKDDFLFAIIFFKINYDFKYNLLKKYVLIQYLVFGNIVAIFLEQIF